MVLMVKELILEGDMVRNLNINLREKTSNKNNKVEHYISWSFSKKPSILLSNISCILIKKKLRKLSINQLSKLVSND